MPRIDYDEDDYDDGAVAPRGASDWRRRALIGGLALCGLGLGFLIPYVLYLNQQVAVRFGQLQWQVPTRVYARPLRLTARLAMDAQTLKTELDAAAYRNDGSGMDAGTYARHNSRWLIASRGFRDVDGSIGPSRIEVALSSGRVLQVRDAIRKRPIKSAQLDPARIATLYGQKQEERRLVRIEEVPELLVTGLQAVEDRDFAHHHGIDLSGILRAAWVNARSGAARQGASTLTQQLARSGLLGIGKEQTFSRKFNEILYALLIEARYDKRSILEAYFNQVYLGQRGAQAIHGVAAAAEFWFGRDLRELSTAQIALLIGMVKGPSAYDPRRHPQRAQARRDFVLAQMHNSDLITDGQYRQALQAPLGVTATPGNIAANRFPAYVNLVRRQLARDYPADALQGAGLSVMTDMSPAAQAYAEGAVAQTLKALDSRRRPALQAGMVVTNVHDGGVVAVVGSRDFAQPGFNRALAAERPVGSLLKPFVYLLALAQPGKYSLASWVSDDPIVVTLDNGRPWRPGNSDGRSHGSVRFIDALAHSYNQATVRLGMSVRPERLRDLIRTLAGIDTGSNPSLILGSIDQSPYAMAQLYQFLASGGAIQPLHAVRGVLDSEGAAMKRYDTVPAPAQQGDAIATRLVTLALQYAVTTGTARQLINDGLSRLHPAGKTGTSNDSRDSWFAGWTGDHLAVVWVGNDQNQPTGLYGATGAMRAWSALFKRLPSASLQVLSAGLEWQWVVQSSSTEAGCPGAQRFAFVAGYAPEPQPCPTADADYTAGLFAPTEPARQHTSVWRKLFGLDHDDVPAAEATPTAPAADTTATTPVPESPAPPVLSPPED